MSGSSEFQFRSLQWVAAICRSPELRRITTNAGALLILQVLSYLLPLMTVPYLVRVLGTEKFGLLAFAAAFASYFQVIVNYGFNLTASRDVSVCRSDHQRLSQIFTLVTCLKMALSLACLIILCALVFSIPRFRPHASVFLWTYAAAVGAAIFPLWFFQGVEMMGYITFYDSIVKLVTALMYFATVRSDEQFMRVLYIQNAAMWSVTFLSLLLAIRRFGLNLTTPTARLLYLTLGDGFSVFLSQISGTLFNNTNTFILGLFYSSRTVGMYAVAEKVVRAAIALTIPITNSIYPRSSVLFKQSKQAGIRFLRRVLLLGIPSFFALSVLVFGAADALVLLVTGTEDRTISILVRIMAILPLSIFVDNVLGVQIMLNMNMEKEFLRAILFAGAFSVVMLLAVVPRYGAEGAAASYLISELLVLALYYLTLRSAGVRILDGKR